MKAVVAIDSFKGCLTSEEAGLAAASAFGAGECEVVPVSDGGEGFSKIVTSGLGREDNHGHLEQLDNKQLSRCSQEC